MIDRASIQDVRQATDILSLVRRHVALRQRGGDGWGRCPFHQEKTESFHVSPKVGMWHCFGCGAGGDAIAFLMRVQGMDFRSAVAWLAEEAGIELAGETPEAKAERRRRRNVQEVNAWASQWFQARLMTDKQGESAREYLRSRKFEQATLDCFGLGLAPSGWRTLTTLVEAEGNIQAAIAAGLLRQHDRRGVYDLFRDRLMFPIRNANGRVVAFGGRLLSGDGPKYINSPESPLYQKSSTLYGLHRALPEIQRSGRVVVVEGYTDAMACRQLGVADCVATCGTALTAQHVAILRRQAGRIIALFDQDKAGQRAAERALPMFLKAGVEVVTPTLPEGSDPAQLMAAGEGALLCARINEAKPLLHKTIVQIQRRQPATPHGAQRAAQEAASLLRLLDDVAKIQATREAASTLGVPYPALASIVGRGAPRQAQAAPPLALDTTTAEVIWLLIHARQTVAHLFEQVNPAWFGSDDERYIIGGLLAGRSVVEITDDGLPDHLTVALRSLALDADRHAVDSAERVAREVLRRREMAWIVARLPRSTGRERFELQQRRLALRGKVS